MEQKKINLGEVAKKVLKCEEPWALQLKLAEGINFREIEEICMEFGKQLLELASENAFGTHCTDYINKESITNTINQVD